MTRLAGLAKGNARASLVRRVEPLRSPSGNYDICPPTCLYQETSSIPVSHLFPSSPLLATLAGMSVLLGLHANNLDTFAAITLPVLLILEARLWATSELGYSNTY